MNRSDRTASARGLTIRPLAPADRGSMAELLDRPVERALWDGQALSAASRVFAEAISRRAGAASQLRFPAPQ